VEGAGGDDFPRPRRTIEIGPVHDGEVKESSDVIFTLDSVAVRSSSDSRDQREYLLETSCFELLREAPSSVIRQIPIGPLDEHLTKRIQLLL